MFRFWAAASRRCTDILHIIRRMEYGLECSVKDIGFGRCIRVSVSIVILVRDAVVCFPDFLQVPPDSFRVFGSGFARPNRTANSPKLKQ